MTPLVVAVGGDLFSDVYESVGTRSERCSLRVKAGWHDKRGGNITQTDTET